MAEFSLDKRVHAFCEANKPICPSETLRGLGQLFAEMAKELMKIDVEEELYVSIEYRMLDIKPHIDILKAECDHLGRPLEKKNGNVLVFNQLFVELLSDLAMFQAKPNEDSCVYILSKYSRLLASIHDPKTACFYNWIYSQYERDPNYDYTAHLPEAGAGSLFILMHEWVHKNPDLIDKISGLLLSSSEFTAIFEDVKDNVFKRLKRSNPYLDNTSINKQIKKVREEVCCDFSSLSMALAFGYEKHFNCTKTDFVGISLLALSVPGIYSFMESIRIYDELKNPKKIADELSDTLSERIRLLVAGVKIALNSNLFFVGCDIDASVKYGLEPILSFLKECGKFYNEGMKARINQFNSMSHEEQDKYIFPYQYYEWNIFS